MAVPRRVRAERRYTVDRVAVGRDARNGVWLEIAFPTSLPRAEPMLESRDMAQGDCGAELGDPSSCPHPPPPDARSRAITRGGGRCTGQVQEYYVGRRPSGTRFRRGGVSSSPSWSSQIAERFPVEHPSVVDEVRRIQRGVPERDGAARAETLSRATSLVDIRPQLRVCCTDNLRSGKFPVGRATFRQVPRSHLFSRTGFALNSTYRRSPAFDSQESECTRSGYVLSLSMYEIF